MWKIIKEIKCNKELPIEVIVKYNDWILLKNRIQEIKEKKEKLKKELWLNGKCGVKVIWNFNF